MHGGRSRASGLAGQLAVDFANTLACDACRVRDALASSRDFSTWLADHPDLDRRVMSRVSLPGLRAFRRHLRATLVAAAGHSAPPVAAMRAINRALARDRVRRSLTWNRGTWMVRTANGRGDPADRFRGVLALSVFDLLATQDRDRLRPCHDPRCAHVLLARTRTQLWCSPTGCGNRARVARHYRQAKARSHGSSRDRSPRANRSRRKSSRAKPETR